MSLGLSRALGAGKTASRREGEREAAAQTSKLRCAALARTQPHSICHLYEENHMSRSMPKSVSSMLLCSSEKQSRLHSTSGTFYHPHVSTPIFCLSQLLFFSFGCCFIIVFHLTVKRSRKLCKLTTGSRNASKIDFFFFFFYPELGPPPPAEKCVVSDRPLKIHTPFSNARPRVGREREVAAEWNSHHKGIFLSLFI